MKDKIHPLFEDNSFDIYEPPHGHQERFKAKLKKKKPFHYKSFGIAASIILIVGLFFGNKFMNKDTFGLSDVSSKMAEAELFFTSTIKQELKEIEKHRNLNTETLIENALNEIEELEENFKTFGEELANNENKRLIIQKMISNYQQRLTILNNLLTEIENKKITTKFEPLEDEII